jgi:hypothetical protein
MKKGLAMIAFWFFAGLWLPAQNASITAPKANNIVWTKDSQQMILWTHAGKATVRLVLFAPNGAKAGIIKSKFPLGNGQFPWSVGKLENGQTVTPAKGYKIQLKIDGTDVILDTSGPFEIATAQIIPPGSPPADVVVLNRQPAIDPRLITPTLKVTNPANGAQVMPGGACPIGWTLIGGGYAQVKIMLYPEGQPHLARTGQVTWISQGTTNDGSYSWKLSPTERTGKYVVRVQTPDGKLCGDSGVLTIGSTALQPVVVNLAPGIQDILPKSAHIVIQQVNFNMPELGLLTGVSVKVLVNATSDFVLDPALGHPQYGALYLRCVVEVPHTEPPVSFKGPSSFSALKIADDVHSLKGSGYYWLGAAPARFSKGTSAFTASFAPHLKGKAVGHEVVRKMVQGPFSAGALCKQQYFSKLTITLHLVTQGIEAVDSRVTYLAYNTKTWPLKSVIVDGEVNICQGGIKYW